MLQDESKLMYIFKCIKDSDIFFKSETVFCSSDRMTYDVGITWCWQIYVFKYISAGTFMYGSDSCIIMKLIM